MELISYDINTDSRLSTHYKQALNVCMFFNEQVKSERGLRILKCICEYRLIRAELTASLNFQFEFYIKSPMLTVFSSIKSLCLSGNQTQLKMYCVLKGVVFFLLLSRALMAFIDKFSRGVTVFISTIKLQKDWSIRLI